MPQVCFYLHLHQPRRLRQVNVFDVGLNRSYYESEPNDGNKVIFQKVAQKSYLPMLELLRDLTAWHKEFKVSFSITGVFLEQAEAYQPEVISLLQEIMASGQAEILGETYYHSLAALYSPAEFKVQIHKHRQIIEHFFKVTPRIFRNTELIYSNEIARQIEQLPFEAILTEAVDRYLHGRPKTKVYHSYTQKKLPLLLKNAELSDDIAFRFSDKNWKEHPLTVEKYLNWVEIYPEDHLVNLFMDFETFGEHQWQDTGIFLFWGKFVEEFIKKDWNKFVLPSEVVDSLQDNPSLWAEHPCYDVPDLISWADVDRDITAWRDNPLQYDTLEKLYALEDKIAEAEDMNLLEDWRYLQTSDHFYYMCTKWAADGDVHSYFSPYDDPYEAYRRFSIALADLEDRLMP